MSLLEDVKEAVVTPKPKAKPSTKNKDGFIKGAEVSEKDYFSQMAKLRQKK